MITSTNLARPLDPAEEAKSKQEMVKLVDKSGEHLASYPIAKGSADKQIRVRHRSADGVETHVTYERTGRTSAEGYSIFREKA